MTHLKFSVKTVFLQWDWNIIEFFRISGMDITSSFPFFLCWILVSLCVCKCCFLVFQLSFEGLNHGCYRVVEGQGKGGGVRMWVGWWERGVVWFKFQPRARVRLREPLHGSTNPHRLDERSRPTDANFDAFNPPISHWDCIRRL